MTTTVAQPKHYDAQKADTGHENFSGTAAMAMVPAKLIPAAAPPKAGKGKSKGKGGKPNPFAKK